MTDCDRAIEQQQRYPENFDEIRRSFGGSGLGLYRNWV
jgi:hypothetical protein